MPSTRRIRLLFYVVLGGVVTTLFFTSHLRAARDAETRNLQDFYHKTVSAMDNVRGAGGGGGQAVLDSKTGKEVGRKPPLDRDADGNVDADDEALAKEMTERLRAAEQKAKELANAKAPNRPDAPSDVIGVGSSAGGQVKKAGGDADADGKQEVVQKTDEEREVDAEMERIMQTSPGTCSPRFSASVSFRAPCADTA